MEQQPDSTRPSTLARAAYILGGFEPLRRYLHVPAVLLALWMSGVEPAPTDVFLKAVDIVEAGKLDALKKRD